MSSCAADDAVYGKEERERAHAGGFEGQTASDEDRGAREKPPFVRCALLIPNFKTVCALQLGSRARGAVITEELRVVCFTSTPELQSALLCGCGYEQLLPGFTSVKKLGWVRALGGAGQLNQWH